MSSAARCTACGASVTARDPFYYDWQGRRFWIHRCDRCTHQFVHPPVSREEQAGIYGDSYFSGEGDWACNIFEGGYTDAEDDLRDEARQILAMLPASGGALLDIGCAGGVFLDEARAVGFECSGIELNATMAEHARTRYGLAVLTTRIEDVPSERWAESFDVITLLDCLEHVPAPLEAMQKVHRWLRPGGAVFVRGPLSNSRLARAKESARRIVGASKRLPGYPLDANMFNKRSLSAMLAACGFERADWIGETHCFSNVAARKHEVRAAGPER